MIVSTSQAGFPDILYTVNAADISALGAATSGSIPLFTLPAGGVITFTKVKHSAPVVGASVSAATAQVATSNNTYGTAFNVFQASGAEVFDFSGTAKKENHSTGTVVNLSVTSTGANLSAVTAGTIQVWVEYIILD